MMSPTKRALCDLMIYGEPSEEELAELTESICLKASRTVRAWLRGLTYDGEGISQVLRSKVKNRFLRITHVIDLAGWVEGQMLEFPRRYPALADRLSIRSENFHALSACFCKDEVSA